METKIIKPEPGRHVHFYPRGSKPGDQPRAAIVAHVWGDRCVNLAVFDKEGNSVVNPPTSVVLVQPGDTPPEGQAFCTWMPYTVAKAAAQA